MKEITSQRNDGPRVIESAFNYFHIIVASVSCLNFFVYGSWAECIFLWVSRTTNRFVSMFHPVTVLISSSLPSPNHFRKWMSLLRGTSSDCNTGLPRIHITRGTAVAVHSVLLLWWRVTGVESSMYPSTFPTSLGCTYTSAGSTLPKSILLGRIGCDSGVDLLWELYIFITFHSSHSRILLVRSVIISAIGHHFKGHGEPSKVSHRVNPLYAALKSYLPMTIGVSR